MRRTQYFALGLLVLLASVASAVTAQAASRVATIEVKGMV
jgi:hypothetical protein